MSTEVVQENLSDIRAADYATAAFFDAPEKVREGQDGKFALAMAYHAIAAGVSAEEILNERDRIAAENGPAFAKAGGSGELPAAVRQSIQKSAEQWRLTCPALAELFDAAPELQTWRAYSRFVMHVDRIARQVALITSIRKQR